MNCKGKIMISLKKRFISIILILSLCFSVFAQEDVEEEYDISQYFQGEPEVTFDIIWPLDLSMFALGIAGYVANYYIEGAFIENDYEKTKYLSREDVNFFDRWAMLPYNEVLDICGDFIGIFSAVAAPFAVYFSEFAMDILPLDVSLNLVVNFTEAFLFTTVIKDALKMTVLRERPYNYFDGPRPQGGNSYDWQYSFPSGHTAYAFMGAGFFAYTFSQMYPESLAKKPLIATAYTFATITGVLRILSGNHFITDVLGGALVGTACGVLFPMVNQFVNSKIQLTENIELSSQFTGLGANFRLSFN